MYYGVTVIQLTQIVQVKVHLVINSPVKYFSKQLKSAFLFFF